MPPAFARWEIYWGKVPEEHAVGSELRDKDGNPHPYLILSDRRLVRRQGIVLACPITSTLREDDETSPFRIRIDAGDVLPARERPSTILAEQTRVMDTKRLDGKRGKVGSLRRAAQPRVELALCALFGIGPDRV